jgi:hypothetical protein
MSTFGLQRKAFRETYDSIGDGVRLLAEVA